MTDPGPPGLAARVGLCGWTVAMSTYVQRFPVLEVQHTFYEPPGEALLRRWRASVPDGFEFTVKAWQVITHDSSSPTYRRLKTPLPAEHRGQVGSFRTTPAVLQGWARTLESASVLRASAVLLQCPKSFRPTDENVQRMRRFLTTVERPAPLRLLWEPRGEWPTALVAELCRELRLAHVTDPMQVETVTPEQTYYRLHGTTGIRHVHTDEELHRLRALVAGHPEPYVLFNNLSRARDAERFLALLDGG
ncbi:DUF72 domain-containing protein [Motilibacter deserti]|uniref:DUF72 domain-containing protein n=1 Tax=Motilibacter deserti TaxID=2714956 RepID=A0ABX0GNW7_9ACTN|nr:DUF72 domain-containing protein [Motilibacter deserti]NHC12536.1 DUF72 domain-containing protein [Motilibacter deserti]